MTHFHSKKRKALHSLGKTTIFFLSCISYRRWYDTTFTFFVAGTFSIFELARARLRPTTKSSRLRTPKCHQLINLTWQYLNSFQNWSSIFTSCSSLFFFFYFVLSPNATTQFLCFFLKVIRLLTWHLYTPAHFKRLTLSRVLFGDNRGKTPHTMLCSNKEVIGFRFVYWV